MFTGLIETVGEITDRQETAAGVRLRIRSAIAGGIHAGDSVAVNGVCLTALDDDPDATTADLGPETCRVTTLGHATRGMLVNLERPLRPDGRLGGHFVLGHVDAVARITDLRPDADFLWLTVAFPAALAPLIVPKGSIAVDGISLTVALLHDDRFDVQIVPYTLDHTNLRGARVGDAVNLECDMVGKYVVRALELAGVTARGVAEGTARRG